jgi:hypothetical protein
LIIWVKYKALYIIRKLSIYIDLYILWYPIFPNSSNILELLELLEYYITFIWSSIKDIINFSNIYLYIDILSI